MPIVPLQLSGQVTLEQNGSQHNSLSQRISKISNYGNIKFSTLWAFTFVIIMFRVR